jgi:methyl-accepting chemotaxis protein
LKLSTLVTNVLEIAMNFLNNLPIKIRLFILVCVLALAGITVGAMGLSGMHDADNALDYMYHSDLHHARVLGVIAEHNQELRSLLMLSLQHDPSTEFATMHNHPVSLHLDLMRKDIDTIEEHWKEYMVEPAPEHLQAAVNTFIQQLDVIKNQGYLPAIEKIESGDYRAANILLLKTINPAITKMQEAMDTLIEDEEVEAAKAFKLANEEYHSMITQVTILLVVSISIGVLLAWVIISGISKGVASVEIVADALAKGDLTGRVDYKSKDEIGHIASAFNRMADKFSTAITQVKESISQLAAAAEETSVVNAQTTTGINQQQMETSQVASAITEMNSTVHEVARSAVSAAEAAKEADATFIEGKRVVDRIIEAIGELAGEVEKSSDVIRELENESVNIGSVLDVIKGIAEQTNLLALNAAIEAARAGEQGRGFAVVADEVRTLAGRTQQSTQEIEEMINRLQSGANRAVQVMEVGKQKSLHGVEQATAAAEALNTINQAVERINTMNTQIASAAEEQSAVTEEINRNIVNINEVAEQTSEGSKQAAQASDDLARLAEQLKKLVGQFTV